jgi:hypothetical protein
MKVKVFRSILHENVGLFVYIFLFLVRAPSSASFAYKRFRNPRGAYSAPIVLDSITVARIRRNCWLLGVAKLLFGYTLSAKSLACFIPMDTFYDLSSSEHLISSRLFACVIPQPIIEFVCNF